LFGGTFAVMNDVHLMQGLPPVDPPVIVVS